MYKETGEGRQRWPTQIKKVYSAKKKTKKNIWHHWELILMSGDVCSPPNLCLARPQLVVIIPLYCCSSANIVQKIYENNADYVGKLCVCVWLSVFYVQSREAAIRGFWKKHRTKHGCRKKNTCTRDPLIHWHSLEMYLFNSLSFHVLIFDLPQAATHTQQPTDGATGAGDPQHRGSDQQMWNLWEKSNKKRGVLLLGSSFSGAERQDNDTAAGRHTIGRESRWGSSGRR